MSVKTPLRKPSLKLFEPHQPPHEALFYLQVEIVIKELRLTMADWSYPLNSCEKFYGGATKKQVNKKAEWKKGIEINLGFNIKLLFFIT